MGKHDKHEEQKVEFKWDPPKDDFYKARIKRLRNENSNLREANKETKRAEAFFKVYAERNRDLDNRNYDLENKLFELQSKYDSALKYIEELEQTKLNLETKVDEYESAILKVVVQI